MNDLVLKGVRVAILAMDGVEKVELTLPRLALEEAGADTVLIAPKPPPPGQASCRGPIHS